MHLRCALKVAAVAAVLVVSPIASAHSAKNTEKGRMAIRNDAGVGLTLWRLLRGNQNFMFTMGLHPALDVFVIDKLSIGGEIHFTFQPRTGGAPDQIAFSVSPRIGYNIPLHQYISFWPHVSVGVGFVHVGGFDTGSARVPSRTDPILPLQLFLPFYVHPVENFFLGLGPALYVQPLNTQPLNTGSVSIHIVRFSIGGSFPVF